jgi:uracil-DNA glycosylase
MSTLDELRIVAEGCTACRLSETRTRVVFGAGNPSADLLFVGEAPGRNEDLQGVPFVGAAGQLLDRLMADAGIDRDRAYIANVLKCRPPNNRDPQPAEIEACKGYLSAQLELIDPRVVVTLGNFASRLLLKTEAGITKLRGRAYPWWRGKTLIATFHPAAALRSGDKVTDLMRADFELIRQALAPRVEAYTAVEPNDIEQLGLFQP